MQKSFKILIFAGLIILSHNGISGQKNIEFDLDKCPREKIMVHLSQESCFTGEVLWFKIYCTSPLFPQDEISCLGFVELVSSENTAVARKKIDLKHGEGSGEIEIPDNLTTGLYYITAYTSWLKNFGESSFFRKKIVIVNPYQPLKSSNDSLMPGILQEAFSPSLSSNDMKVQTHKRSYSPREKVIVRIDSDIVPVKNFSGNFSVSVNKKAPELKYFLNQNSSEAGQEDTLSRFYLPDHNGIVLSGILSDQSGNGVGNALLVISEPGPGTDIDSYVTGPGGEFNFLLKPGEGEEGIVITLPGSDLKISLAEPFWNGFRNPPGNAMVSLDSEAVAYFRERFNSFQLQKRFNRQNLVKRSPAINMPDSSLFYLQPYQTIDLGKYILLDSLVEYFNEFVPSVRISRRRGIYDIQITDLKTQSVLREEPAVFLDGVLLDDFGVVADYPPSELDRICILREAYYYKDLSFGGIIDIHTKKSDFNGLKAPDNLTRFIYPKANSGDYLFLSPDYSETQLNEKTPDLRYLLDWEPDVRTDSTGAATIQFYTGDIKGTFVVEVTGLSDNGEILKARCMFRVE